MKINVKNIKKNEVFHKNHESLQNIINDGVGVVQPITNRVYQKNAYLLLKYSSWIIFVLYLIFKQYFSYNKLFVFSNLRLKGNIKINTF